MTQSRNTICWRARSAGELRAVMKGTEGNPAAASVVACRDQRLLASGRLNHNCSPHLLFSYLSPRRIHKTRSLTWA